MLVSTVSSGSEFLQKIEKEIYLSCADILYMESENVYIRVTTKEKSYLIRKKLKEQINEIERLQI